MGSHHRVAVVVTVATPLAVWFLIGQLAEGSGSDHIFRVPGLAREVEAVVGLAALSIVCGGLLSLWLGDRSWLIGEGWWQVYGRLLLAGVLVAVGGRIVTAASSGANIGGGAIFMVGPLPVLYLLEGARVEARRLRARR